MEEVMPINWNAADREEDELVRQVNSGVITQQQFNRAMRDLQDEIRGCAEEDSERAYNEAMGNR
jgi:predicted RNA-binding protein associated with RNAse of E/G family